MVLASFTHCGRTFFIVNMTCHLCRILFSERVGKLRLKTNAYPSVSKFDNFLRFLEALKIGYMIISSKKKQQKSRAGLGLNI